MKFLCYTFLILFLGAAPLGLSGQEKVVLNNDFKFKDGLYFSIESFKANEPDIEWEDTHTELFVHPDKQSAIVYFLSFQDTLEDKIWGFSYKGVPFLRIVKDVDSDYSEYSALSIRGKLCYFVFETRETKEVVIKAYNPLTGRPFREGTVENIETIRNRQLLHFGTGEIADFTVESFVNWIQDDEQLVKTIQDLSSKEAEEKLFKCLLIYNDRNVVKVNTNN